MRTKPALRRILSLGLAALMPLLPEFKTQAGALSLGASNDLGGLMGEALQDGLAVRPAAASAVPMRDGSGRFTGTTQCAWVFPGAQGSCPWSSASAMSRAHTRPFR